MWVTFVVAIILSALPLASGAISFQLTGAAGTDTDTIQEMRDHYTWVKISDSDDKYEAPGAASTRRPSLPLATSIIYEGITGSNMFTKAAIEAQIEYETALLGLPGWCALPTAARGCASSLVGPNLPPPAPPAPAAAGAHAASWRGAPSTRATRVASLHRRCCATCSATARSRRRSARPASVQHSASARTPHRLWRSARPRATASSRASRLCTTGVTALWRPRRTGQSCSPPRSARTRARSTVEVHPAPLARSCPAATRRPGGPLACALGPAFSAQWRTLASRLGCRRGCDSALGTGQSRGFCCMAFTAQA